MKHQSEARFPAPSKVVIKMFTDRDFHERKLEGLGLLKYKVLAHEFDGADFMIKIERKVPVQAPGMVKKVVAAESTVVHEERWNLRRKTGRVVAQPQGMPVEITCEAVMSDDGGACLVRYDWNVHAKLPLVGGQLEKFIIADMTKRADEETRVAIALLDPYR